MSMKKVTKKKGAKMFGQTMKKASGPDVRGELKKANRDLLAAEEHQVVHKPVGKHGVTFKPDAKEGTSRGGIKKNAKSAAGAAQGRKYPKPKVKKTKGY